MTATLELQFTLEYWRTSMREQSTRIDRPIRKAYGEYRGGRLGRQQLGQLQTTCILSCLWSVHNSQTASYPGPASQNWAKSSDSQANFSQIFSITVHLRVTLSAAVHASSVAKCKLCSGSWLCASEGSEPKKLSTTVETFSWCLPTGFGAVSAFRRHQILIFSRQLLRWACGRHLLVSRRNYFSATCLRSV